MDIRTKITHPEIYIFAQKDLFSIQYIILNIILCVFIFLHSCDSFHLVDFTSACHDFQHRFLEAEL